jgi:hypothetical protein
VIVDVCAALGALLEAAPIEVVPLDAEPLVWDLGKLYVYPVRVDEVPFETSTARRQEFELNAVRILSNDGEEARQHRSAELAAELDEIRGGYLELVRHNQAGPPWQMLSGRSDTTSPRMLDKRSAGIRVSGWRIIGG